ncbi:phospholipase D-like domain-containing protein [Rickettsiales endosymbiont of Stachyamoeba lipophora]|uniref:phospholipase D-like domain-containing protein n=1 Tax=Rickettsiales endosymbiont of Stachyamoeba lipophora TaxID=2486578 RepID=UPI0013DDD23B|nr:phosphatidylserine/phosphatidylglycerophosphate/cardiolipin synthase family protein [Rickettsiales endosymbiont of Stachyamoeba lipophora]
MTQNINKSWQWYNNTPAFLDEMYISCSKATKSILLEQYIIKNDQVGRKFLKILTKKAKQGVKVAILCDWIGGIDLWNSPLIKVLIQNGGKFYFYNSIRQWHPFKITTWFTRDHRKILLIDSQIVFIGGFCLDQRMYNWHDLVIKLSSELICNDIKYYFELLFNENISNKKRNLTTFSPITENGFKCLVNNAKRHEKYLYQALLEQIKQARNYIYLVTPYFIPEENFFQSLKEAVTRKVEIVLLIPESSHIKLIDYITFHYYIKAIQAKIKIFQFKDQLLHAKYAIIDDEWAMVGSMNFDYLSLMKSNELSLVITNHQAIVELKNLHCVDLMHSKELSINELYQKPLWQKIIGLLGLIFKKLL